MATCRSKEMCHLPKSELGPKLGQLFSLCHLHFIPLRFLTFRLKRPLSPVSVRPPIPSPLSAAGLATAEEGACCDDCSRILTSRSAARSVMPRMQSSQRQCSHTRLQLQFDSTDCTELDRVKATLACACAVPSSTGEMAIEWQGTEPQLRFYQSPSERPIARPEKYTSLIFSPLKNSLLRRLALLLLSYGLPGLSLNSRKVLFLASHCSRIVLTRWDCLCIKSLAFISIHWITSHI